MTDKVLLEHAAKAAGIEIFFDDDGDFYRVKASGNRRFWNPLIDDGDALRLAVDLKMSLYINHAVRVDYRIPHGIFLSVPLYEPLEPNAYAATRRAIVRAAAEIGKTMGEQA